MEKRIITEQEIIDTLKKENSNITDTDMKQKLFHYYKDNGLQSIGSHHYAKSDFIYDYELGTFAEDIRTKLNAQYPEISLAIWETRILNEWLNLLIAKNTIIIEVPKYFLDIIYDAISEIRENQIVLVNPNIEEYFRYQRNDLIVLKALLDRAPITKKGHLTIEKLFVDLLCDKFLNEMFDSYTIQKIIQDASVSYAINEKKLLAYARRRGKYNEVSMVWRKINDR